MCDVCCKEFRGWCKSFTWLEALLAILEAVLILVFIGFLTFLVLHFLACTKRDDDINWNHPNRSDAPSTTTTGTNRPRTELDSAPPPRDRNTLAPDVECSWTPSEKTEATAHYFDGGFGEENDAVGKSNEPVPPTPTTTSRELASDESYSDDEAPETAHESFALALIKVRPLQDLVFGCILTMVSEYWTVTAASCIEEVEEVDSLDSFVIAESHAALGAGGARGVADVAVHPRYGAGAARAHDLAALRSDGSLFLGGGAPAALPDLVDFFLFTVGERFSILGYGSYRTLNRQVSGRHLREVHVYALPGAACEADGGDAWAPRHLGRGGAAGAGTGVGGARGVCAAPRGGRGPLCQYCGGTPLVARGGRLLGVRAAGDCGTCEPALYVNVPLLGDWLRFIIREQ